MPVFYLVSCVFLYASSSIFGTFYNRKNKLDDGNLYYNFIQCTSAFFFWLVISIKDFTFDFSYIPYAVLFALCYTVFNVSFLLALRKGPSSITSLFSSLSLVLVSVYGMFFWGSEISIKVIIGLILVIVSLCLCLITKGSESRLSFPWLILSIISLISNAGCSITQKMEQFSLDYRFGNEMMCIATFLSSISCLILIFVFRSKGSRYRISTNDLIPLGSGVFNGLLNLFVILLASTSISPNLIYPITGVGGLIIIMMFSIFLFKERLKVSQWIGVAIGILAVLLLSI